ncbi:hypothetical protein PVAP13_4KG209610 [Panicum virgatum]|uniref:Uncharacterized protein n=1 Tax=Panicum virgatum TaxID=38727 RepID=A0A8T0TS26_PANVG|nr:hypothetical protein PVAP13_4KG209610 [Panicum virgatum]
MAPSRAGISSLCAGKRHGRAPRSAGKNRQARAAVRGKIDGKKPERRRQSSPPPIPCSSLSLLRLPPLHLHLPHCSPSARNRGQAANAEAIEGNRGQGPSLATTEERLPAQDQESTKQRPVLV